MSDGRSKTPQAKEPQSPVLKPNLVLGIKRVGPGEVMLLKQSGDSWSVVASDIFAVIEGKIREHLYNEVFLK